MSAATDSSELSPEEIDRALKRLVGWKIQSLENPRGRDGLAVELVTTFKFKTFEDAIHFMSTAAGFISETDHHPRWENEYRDVRIRLTTHDAGNRVTNKDVRLAEYLQKLRDEQAAI